MRWDSRVGLTGLVAVASVVVGCGGDGRAAPRVEVDEREGRVGEVRLGDSRERVVEVLGEPEADTDGRMSPTAHDFYDLGLPWVVGPPADVRQTGRRPQAVRYEDLSVLLTREAGVYAIFSARQGMVTATGVRLGDRLTRARDAMPGLRCGRRNEGSEYVTYPYCTGRVGRDRYVWFGGDPVASITLATTALG
jgi:hypothetical protein